VRLIEILVAVSVSACASTPLAPGADKVKITRIAAEVANCKALGNLDQGPTEDANASARNHAIGLGGDTVLDTTSTNMYGMVLPLRTGIIYRCGP
jgi:hypothetical protein